MGRVIREGLRVSSLSRFQSIFFHQAGNSIFNQNQSDKLESCPGKEEACHDPRAVSFELNLLFEKVVYSLACYNRGRRSNSWDGILLPSGVGKCKKLLLRLNWLHLCECFPSYRSRLIFLEDQTMKVWSTVKRLQLCININPLNLLNNKFIDGDVFIIIIIVIIRGCNLDRIAIFVVIVVDRIWTKHGWSIVELMFELFSILITINRNIQYWFELCFNICLFNIFV